MWILSYLKYVLNAEIVIFDRYALKIMAKKALNDSGRLLDRRTNSGKVLSYYSQYTIAAFYFEINRRLKDVMKSRLCRNYHIQILPNSTRSSMMPLTSFCIWFLNTFRYLSNQYLFFSFIMTEFFCKGGNIMRFDRHTGKFTCLVTDGVMGEATASKFFRWIEHSFFFETL